MAEMKSIYPSILKRTRKAAGLTQKEFGEKVGFSGTAVSEAERFDESRAKFMLEQYKKYENGYRRLDQLSEEQLDKLFDTLNKKVTVDVPIDKNLVKRLDEYCKMIGFERIDVIEYIIIKYLEGVTNG